MGVGRIGMALVGIAWQRTAGIDGIDMTCMNTNDTLAAIDLSVFVR